MTTPTRPVLPRGTRVFVAQVGFPQYGRRATVHRLIKNVTSLPDDRWYSFRVDGQKKLDGCIVHESWLTVLAPETA